MRDQAPVSLDTREQRSSSFFPPDFLLVSSCDEGLMSTAKMSQFLRDPKGAAAPFNISLGRPTRIWSWFEEPGNTWRGRRFNAVMVAVSARFPSWIFTDSKCTRPILLARALLTYVGVRSQLEVYCGRRCCCRCGRRHWIDYAHLSKSFPAPSLCCSRP